MGTESPPAMITQSGSSTFTSSPSPSRAAQKCASAGGSGQLTLTVETLIPCFMAPESTTFAVTGTGVAGWCP